MQENKPLMQLLSHAPDNFFQYITIAPVPIQTDVLQIVQVGQSYVGISRVEDDESDKTGVCTQNKFDRVGRKGFSNI